MARPLEYEELPSGKRIFRTFDPDGSLVREQQSYGLLDIGITYVFSGGAKIEETYFSKKKLVGRRAYEKARGNYPDMPEPDTVMEDWGTDVLRSAALESREHKLESKRHQANADNARDKDNFCKERLREGKTEDAVEWIRTKGHTLGERDPLGTKRLVERLVAAGCLKIWACEIDTYEDGAENTGHLVIKLPKARSARAKVFNMIDRLARETGYSGPLDDGEQYAYVKLD
jgi:hypothetical protein